ncbi:cellulase family glycosylhydrolase [Chlorogloeopsis sp. ULAP01]|uniref:glycoside hydrolase family 5 protein n=1 Tax=Chlorogloeopsis sp. ULAP01 TaxID=3056483 RepID=UPI0025AB4840|nr:cellulase family glycosylhydrolase [Chlorogloeopsis sp. ULAP01]MDM9382416.1 cellulase family glycosylhydrolase [Chlorogloeopsis sp. ULAP01]
MNISRFKSKVALFCFQVAQVASLLSLIAIGDGRALAQMHFKTVGSKIYDPEGKEFVIKGVNVQGPNWVWPIDITRDVNAIGSSCWNFNLVRVNSLLFLGETPWRQYTSNNDINKIVREFTSRGIVVMFEAHDRTGRFYEGEDLTALINWHRDLANRYKDNPYVWFNVMNEPGDNTYDAEDRSKWLGVNQAVIKAIRDDAGAKNVIVVDGIAWGQEGNTWNASFVPTENSAILSDAANILNFDGKGYKNIVFSIHIWDLWNFGDAKLANYVDRVLSQNVPLIIGEFGVTNNGIDVTSAMNSMYNVAVPRKIGRIVWHWYNGGPNNGLSNRLTNTPNGNTGAAIDSCTNPSNLSNLGRRVWEDTRTRE